MHTVINPKVLYFGTPVVLISTVNEDGSANLAPMSSAWWMGSSCMLGMSSASQTVQNLMCVGECVLNLPSADLVAAVNRLALRTGRNPVPEYKVKMGYTFESNKFATAMLTAQSSDLVSPPRVAECPVQLEAKVHQMHAFDEDHADPSHPPVAIEVRIVRVHVDESLLVPGQRNYIDPEKWNPLIMNFCEFFGLSGKVHASKLAQVYGPPR